MKAEEMVWYDYYCEQCGYSWESIEPNPDREWCACGTVEIPMMMEKHD